MRRDSFVNSGIFLFIDLIITNLGNWLFWLVISRLSSAAEIGQATAVFSLASLFSIVTQLGMEYPLLKRSSVNLSEVLGTTIVLELAITIAVTPIMIMTMFFGYPEALKDFTLIATTMFIFSSIGFVFRHALIGISNIRALFIIDIIGTAVRFAVGYAFVSWGNATYGILLSLLLQSVIVTIMMFLGLRRFSFKIGKILYIKEIIAEALANTPPKLSKMLIPSLSIVLLAYFSIRDSDLGIFYIIYMISMLAGGLASSIAVMVIPASSSSKVDLSSGSIRLGLSLTVPFIVVLLIAPKQILSLLGESYLPGWTALQILAIAILPYSVIINNISRLNNLNQYRKLVILGSLEISLFTVLFSVLVPILGIVGAAISILISFTISALLSLYWNGRSGVKHILNSCLAVFAGWLPSYIIIGFYNVHFIAPTLVSISISIIVILVLKNTSISEIRNLIKTLIANREHQ